MLRVMFVSGMAVPDARTVPIATSRTARSLASDPVCIARYRGIQDYRAGKSDSRERNYRQHLKAVDPFEPPI